MGVDRHNVWLPDEELWRCLDHPSLPRTGVCPQCLRLRLLRLCPLCASDLPCSCSSSITTTTTNTSSSSSSSSLDHPPISHLLQMEPPFRRSRSSHNHRTWSSFFRPIFGASKKPSIPVVVEEEDPKPTRLHRSRSVGVESKAKAAGKTPSHHMVPPRHSCSNSSSSSSAWGKATRSWYFPSPMKAFALRSSSGGGKHERSSICRG